MEKRKLKRYQLRVPKDRVGIDEIVEGVFEKTGFAKSDVKIVYRAICEIIKEKILEKRGVNMPSLGLLFPRIRPQRRATDLAKGAFRRGENTAPKVITVPAKFVLRFNAEKNVKRELGELGVSKEEEDNLYID